MSRLALALTVAATLVAAACSKPAPPEGSTRTTITTPSGIELDAIELGDGPKVAVLSHGATGTKEDFYPIAEAFAADGWRVIAYDGPGRRRFHRDERAGPRGGADRRGRPRPGDGRRVRRADRRVDGRRPLTRDGGPAPRGRRREPVGARHRVRRARRGARDARRHRGVRHRGRGQRAVRESRRARSPTRPGWTP